MGKTLSYGAISGKGKTTKIQDWLDVVTKLNLAPLMEYDEATDTYSCTVPAVERFLQIASNGDKRWLASFFRRKGKFRRNILNDNDGRVRMFLLANALERAMNGDMAWSKHAIEIIDIFNKADNLQDKLKAKKGKGFRGNRTSFVAKRAAAEVESDLDLRGMDGEGEGDAPENVGGEESAS